VRLPRVHSGKACCNVADVYYRVGPCEGIRHRFQKPKIDIDKLRDFKNRVVGTMTAGGGRSQLNKIQHLQGWPRPPIARTPT